MKRNRQKKIDDAVVIFRKHHGTLRMMEAVRLGIHRRILYAMRDSGILKQISRGLYRLAELPPLANPDLAIVASKVPRGVICLISALAYHDITVQIPHTIYIAMERNIAEAPRLKYPPLRVFWFTGSAFHEGIETYTKDNIPVRIYNPEKTIADCFKYRNKIGVDVAIEALKLYREHKPFKPDDLIRYARICRVENVMRPYFEAII